MTSIWNELGIAPGSDEPTIRRAYARKLKVTQPEDDPQGFQRLRQAYEQAMGVATRPRQPPSSPSNRPSRTVDSSDTAAVSQPGPDTDEASQLRSALETQGQELAICLQSADAREWERVREIQAAMLASRLLDDIVVRASLENWMAHQIASHTPRSDALIEPAAQFFEWDERRLRQPSPAVATVLRRRQEVAFVAQLTNPDHEWHLGWSALTPSNVPSWRRALGALQPGKRKQVAALLQKAVSFPGLRHDFDAEAMAWWQRRLTPTRFENVMWCVPTTLLLVFLAVLAANAMLRVLSLPAGLAVTAAISAILASFQVLVVRPRLALWFKRYRRAADSRWWIGTLAISPWICWEMPLTPIALLVILGGMGGALSWQDGWLSAFPHKQGAQRNIHGIVAGWLWLALVSGIGAATLGRPRIFVWLALSIPFAVMWYRGSHAILIQLDKMRVEIRRTMLLSLPLFVLTISVLAIGWNNFDLHFGSTLLVGPMILLLPQGRLLEQREWRQRLHIPYRILVMIQLVLIFVWSGASRYS